MIKERNYLFDNIKAILIFSVVIAHYFRASSSFTVSSFGGVIYILSFSYIMQGFLFVSGYFSKNPEKSKTTAFQTFLFPYIILMPIMFLLRFTINGKAHFDLTLPTMALWYLLTLFIYRYFLKDFIKVKNILPYSIAVSLAAGYIPFLDSTLSLGRTFSFLPFFLLGYYFKPEWTDKLHRLPKAISWFLLSVLIAFTIHIAFYSVFPLEALYMKGSYASTGLTNGQGILLRIAISLISLAWIFVFVNLTPKNRTFLTVIGQNTMTVYILHIIARYFIKGMGGSFGQDIPSYLFLVAAAILSVWVFSWPSVSERYRRFMDNIYQFVVAIPLTLIRQIL
jgi:fucose 4-O-acetylase-like acetyltransferase